MPVYAYTRNQRIDASWGMKLRRKKLNFTRVFPGISVFIWRFNLEINARPFFVRESWVLIELCSRNPSLNTFCTWNNNRKCKFLNSLKLSSSWKNWMLAHLARFPWRLSWTFLRQYLTLPLVPRVDPSLGIEFDVQRSPRRLAMF